MKNGLIFLITGIRIIILETLVFENELLVFRTYCKIFIFSNKVTADHADKSCKVSSFIDLFSNAFLDDFSDAVDQSIDEHMIKYKGRSSMRLYLLLKPIN